VRESTNILRCS